MTLSEMRAKFQEVTGRYDLTDAQVDFYLNAGSRKLYRSVEGEQFQTELTVSTCATYYYDLPNALSVDAIFIVSDSGRERLHRMYPSNFFQFFPDFESADGTPIAWTLGNSTSSSKRIIFNCWTPPTTETVDGEEVTTYYITFLVRYRKEEVFDSTDTSSETWWSVNYPEALIFASAFVLEAFYRNSEGMRDWLNALQSTLDDVEFEFMSFNFREHGQMNELGL